jgi:transcriptional regulator with GAF, ATPase, and Fis domain
MLRIKDVIRQVADKKVTVLIEGESGTGKEIVANALFRHSNRKDHPFLKVNCGALTQGILESELFGHEKGSFTGAVGLKKGLFESADKGTLFLDEIGEMPLESQVRLLRVLESGEFSRVGGVQAIRTDVRIIAATNKDLEQEVEAGAFREDLFYRLKVISIHLPPCVTAARISLFWSSISWTGTIWKTARHTRGSPRRCSPS